MAHIVFITRARPSANGPGGRRRTTQLVHELALEFGAEHVRVISLQDWLMDNKTRPSPIERTTTAIKRRLRNPATMLIDTGIDFDGYAARAFYAHIAAALDADPRPKVVVIDDARLAPIIDLAAVRGLPCVVCPHNFESLDRLPTGCSRWRRHAHMSDFAEEIGILQRASARVMISTTEAGFVSALGSSAFVHPYRPVGALAEPLLRIRRRRASEPPDPSLFVMLGSAMHESTFHAMQRLVMQWRRSPLPQGMRIVIAGAGTERFGRLDVPGVEVRGWLEADELHTLLVSARAALIPQDHGFGAVTRLADMSCAGVPVVASHHVAHALDMPPGIRTAGPDWEEWLDLLQAEPSPTDHDAYARWDQAQPRTLVSTIEKFLR